MGLRWTRTELPYLDVIFKSRIQAHGRMGGQEDRMMGAWEHGSMEA